MSTFGFRCYLGCVPLWGWYCELFHVKEECFVNNKCIDIVIDRTIFIWNIHVQRGKGSLNFV